MNNNILANRYIKAFQASTADRVETALTQLLATVEGILNSKVCWELLRSPVLSNNQKEEILEKSLSHTNLDKAIENFYKLVVQKKRLKLLPELKKSIKRALLDHKKIAEAIVYTAEELDQKNKDNIKSSLEETSKKSVSAQFIKDENMLGGIKIFMDNKIFDGTIENSLQLFFDTIKN